MNNIIERIWNQGSMVTIEDLSGAAFQAESGGHTFRIRGVDKDGNALTLSGTPSGVMLRADGQDVTLTCSVSGGVVTATLPANAYSVPGRFGITIFLTSDSQKTALYAAIGSVVKTSSGTVAPPAGSDVVDLINQINTAIAAIPVNYNASFAPAYSTSGLYSVGQYVTYDGNLYRCISTISSGESWTSSHWTQVALANDVCDLKSAITSLIDDKNILNTCEEYKVGWAGNTVTPIEASSYSVYTFIPVVANTAYKCNFDARWIVYMGTNKQASGQATSESVSAGTSFTPNYNGYIHITILNTTANYYNAKACLSSVSFDDIAKYNKVYISKKYMAQDVSEDCQDSILGPVNQALEYVHSYKIDESIYNSGVLTDITSNYSNKIIDSEFIRPNGTTPSNSGYQRTDYIDIDDLDGVTVFANYSSGITSMQIYDADHRIIDTKTETINNLLITAYDLSIQYKLPKYVRFCTYYGADNSKKLKFQKNTGTTTVSEKIQEIEAGVVGGNPLRGKKLAVDGDSICAGAGYAGGYAKIIGDRNSMTVQNLAVGGATLASGTGKHIICESMMNLDDDADYIIIEGGVNDSPNGVTIGNFTAGYNNTLSTQYFYGAIETVCKQLSYKFAGKKYGFLIPHQMSSKMKPKWNNDLGQFHDAIVLACMKWGVPLLDLSVEVSPFEGFANSGNANLVAVADAYTADTTSSGHGDGWHPNQAGYEKYYVNKIEAWLKSL